MSTLEQQIDKLLNHRANSKTFYLDVYHLTGSIHASVVYQAIVSVFEFLWNHPDYKKQIQARDGWFYLKGNYITQRTGIRINHLSRYLNKLVKFELLEKEVRVNVERDGHVTWYRLREYIKGGYPQGGDTGIPKVGTSRAGAFLTGKLYKEENKSVAPLRGLLGGSKRTSIPGESKHSKMELPRGVSERLYQYTKFIDEKIRANRVGEYSSAEIEKRVWDGAVELNRLITKEKVTFTQIKEVLEWAATNTFWKANFQSVARLRAKSKNGEIKFQNMYSAFVLEQEKNAPMEEKIQSEIIDRLKSKTFTSRQERESKMETHCEDVAGIRDWMTTLSTLAIQKGKPPANFQNSFPTLRTKIIPFVIWLDDEMYGAREASISYNEAWDIIHEYLQYIKERLNKITLGPWLFEIGSKDFFTFLKETGIKHVLRRYRNDCQ